MDTKRCSQLVCLVVVILGPQLLASRSVHAQVVVSQSPAPIMSPQPMAPATVESRPNLGMIIPGAVLLGVGWVTCFVAGLPAGDDPFDSGVDHQWDTFRGVSLIPVAGPWVMLAVKPTGFHDDYWGPWLVINGLLQTAGFVLLVVGIATPREEAAARSPSVRLLPHAVPGGGGLALAGTFG